MRDKTARVVKLSARITSAAGIEAAEMRDIARSAYLAKADLVTSAVIEFTSVQGIMGSYYATAAGEAPRVARAIAEHYRPRFSGDAIPTDIIGQVVALSDKIDTICGLFAVGQAPTGSSDPFALRRAALGVLAILEETGLPISLVETIDGSLIIYREAGLQFDNAEVRREIIDFFITREKVALRDAGVKADTIDAVLACGIEEPIVLARRARALEAARTENPQVFDDLATAFARANNLRGSAWAPATRRPSSRMWKRHSPRPWPPPRATWPPLSPTTATPTPSLPWRPCARRWTSSSTPPWSWTRIRRFARTA